MCCGISAVRSITALLPAENVVVTVIPIGILLRLLPTVSVFCGSNVRRNVTILPFAVTICCNSTNFIK